MAIVINDETLVAYSQCPRKAYNLIYTSEPGQPQEFHQIIEQNRIANSRKFFDVISLSTPDILPYSIENLNKGCKIFTNAALIVDELRVDCDVLTKVSKQNYEPTIIIGSYKINESDKLHLMLIGYMLSKIQGRYAEHGHIVTMGDKPSLIKLQHNQKKLHAVLDPLLKWVKNDSPPAEPPVILNKHCSLCQFRQQCEAKAIQEDNLSRLQGVTPRIIRRYERKGIFTVKQLSYIFKPRKRNKHARRISQSIHKIELQALAIRTERIYLQELPSLTRNETELFFDIESIPDQDTHYLLGLLICQREAVKYQPFWGNGADDEKTIWYALLDLLNQYPDAPIYHYGSYELRTIIKLAKRYKTDSANLSARLINVHKQIHGKVYFPVYSNRLKSVAALVGASWTHPDASGLQSIVWRYKWEKTHDDRYKDTLLKYNEEDCRALKLLVDALYKIQLSADIIPEVDFADRLKQRTTEASEKVISQFNKILEFGHFDCESKKIRFRQEDEIKEPKRDKREICKLAFKKNLEKLERVRHRAKRRVQVPHENICQRCGYEPLSPRKAESRRFIVNLVLTKNGIKKTIAEYYGAKAACPKCKGVYAPPALRKYSTNRVYGHGFRSWQIFQRVALRLPYESIVESAIEHYGEDINVGSTLYSMERFAEYYASTEKKIMEGLLKSPFVHVDETRANIQGGGWYVWVFTDNKHVILKLTDTRETTVVQELLSQYHGILISDFYGGYDTIPCIQQRCWAHLIGNLNEDIRKNPFDMEFEAFILGVRELILPIMEDIQKYGLKKRNLHKFKKKVDNFYTRMIVDKQYKSDLVNTYQKRFARYRESLFTFLEQDGVPWNNNAAERAIRPFAIQRDASTPFQATVLRNYLVMLGIRQTCRFQNKSFFKFLFSERTDLENFQNRSRRR